MNKNRITGIVFLLLIAGLAPRTARAAAPAAVTPAGKYESWAPSATVLFDIESQNDLGKMPNAQAAAMVRKAFDVWAKIDTAKLPVFEEIPGPCPPVVEVQPPQPSEGLPRGELRPDLGVQVDDAAALPDSLVEIGVFADHGDGLVKQPHPVEHVPAEGAQVDAVHGPALPTDPELGVAHPAPHRRGRSRLPPWTWYCSKRPRSWDAGNWACGGPVLLWWGVE